jgi:hypothetical protein
VCCVYSLVTGVSKWLPKWDFTSLQPLEPQRDFSFFPLISAFMDLVPTVLAICRLVTQLRGLFTDARAHGVESVETLVFARSFPEWPGLGLHGSWYAIDRAGTASLLWLAEREPVRLVSSEDCTQTVEILASGAVMMRVAIRKSPRVIDMRIPVRDCMTEGRMTTHGWGACTFVEGTRAPSTGDAIERTRDSTRPPWEKSSLGQNRVTLYSFPTMTTVTKRLK